MSKVKVGLVFGGRSSEHEVSLQSAKNIVDAIDRSKYELVLFGIDKEGKWHVTDPESFLINEDDPQAIQLKETNERVGLIPGQTKEQFINATTQEALQQIDVIFPVVHGTLGEDGSLQGILRTANLPFVGADLLSSAVSMDKDMAKRLLREAGIDVAKGVVLKKHQLQEVSYDRIKEKYGLPLFIKPVNQGSSVGVSKVENEDEFHRGLQEAFLYDHKVLIEEAIIGREIECAILGNESPIASVPGEILPQKDFYSYESKYIDETGAKLAAPADLTEEETDHVQKQALKVYDVLECEGMARVDFFMKSNGQLVVNEVNTIPGFTKISMYPRLWGLSGIGYPELIDRLITLAFERHERNQLLKSSKN